MSVRAWILAHKLPSALIAVLIAVPPSAAAVFLASSSGGGIEPTSVLATYTNGRATITWNAPSATVTGYRVTLYPYYTDRVPAPNLGPNGGMVQVTVPPGTHSRTFSNLLMDCHQRYEISVEAQTSGGLSKPVYTPSFRPSGNVVSSQDPPYVVVLVDGIGSQSPGFTLRNAYDPTPQGLPPSYCPEGWDPNLQPAPGVSVAGSGKGGETEADIFGSPDGPWNFLHKWNVGEIADNGSPDTSDFNKEYESEPKQLASNGGASSFTHHFMLDDLAAQGAVILPFSYATQGCDASTGAQLTGTFADPVFNFPAYNTGDSTATDCGIAHIGAFGGGFGFGPGVNYWGDVLDHEVTSIHNMWPASKIVVIGHSQGGLVTTDAWLEGFNVPHIQAFSLDSPINGSCGTPGCLGPPGYPPYDGRTGYDQGSDGYLGIDQSLGDNMHFIGTYGDSPAFGPFRSYGTGAETLEHQMPFDYSQQDPRTVEDNCNVQAGSNGGWPEVNSNCSAPSPPDYVSPCPVDFYSVAQWIQDTGHFVVKYCPGVINYINHSVGVSETQPVRPDELAVLGDSYSSGEGSGHWISPTGDGNFLDKTGDTCHRSQDAYAVTILNADVFGACSGSTSSDIENGARGEGSQLAHLGPAIKNVVLSAGGDDAGFATVITACTTNLDVPIHAVQINGPTACGTAITTAESGFPTIGNNLVGLFKSILGPHPNLKSSTVSPNYAANANLYVVGYPYLFPPQGFDGCNGILPANQVLLNKATDALNNTVKVAVNTVNAETGPGQVSQNGPRATFVDVSNVTQNHWICGNPPFSSPYINDLQFRISDAAALVGLLGGPPAWDVILAGIHNCASNEVSTWKFGKNLGICTKSYHPNQDGTRAIGQMVLQCIQNPSTCDTNGLPTSEPFPGELSCTPQDFCMDLGSGVSAEWNGYRWRTTPMAFSAFGESCVSPVFCAAVADVDGQSGVATWTGSAWSFHPLYRFRPSHNLCGACIIGEELRAISCTSPTFCLLVGYSGRRVYRWDGQTWTRVQSSAEVMGQDWDTVLSCSSAVFCSALGPLSASSLGTWNGSDMSQGPNFPGIRSASSGFLSDMDCVLGQHFCMVVGLKYTSPYDFSGPAHFVAATWNGQTWGPPMDLGTADALSSYPSVTCASRSQCIVQDSADPSVRTSQNFLWDGKAWRRIPTSRLDLVSCDPTGGCMDPGVH